MERLKRAINTIEETAIALLLAGMTIVTFSQVVARYVFNTGWGGALEFSRILFAWLILFGISYGVKVGAHLGVDALVRVLPKPIFRALAIFGALCAIVYAVIFFYGSCGNPFKTGGLCTAGYVGRVYKIGLLTEDLDWPRWMVYSILPIGMTLFAARCLQAIVQILRGKREMIIASHEAEDLLREHEGVAKG